MWRKEILAAIEKKQSVTIRLMDGEILQGIAETCADRVKIRSDNGVVYIPILDIDHVSRLIQLR
ncbi:hypothetical protein SAMN05661091_4119 [Paenibacillus uliginis N3/975]|uniref:Host factor-I protein n=1 Tax=Paenibacillus uliginis N3/975 TaxID=1313296 RepID=A0A1X7HK77_9BACL|nr:hypothetical protein [Paenibacillus uliginis]SMF88106.1 hypothetical protein SAMN05661091_4119 [Paenibacillus uliginis N3/975]